MIKLKLILPALFLSSNVLARTSIRESLFQPVEIKSVDSCFSPVEKCDVKIISFIQKAQTRLDIAIFALTHSGISNAIKQAKAKGIAVRLVIDREQSLLPNSKAAELKSQGVDIKFGLAESMMHNKITIVDLQQAETGSYNYTLNATTNNLENQIYFSDETLVKRVCLNNSWVIC